MNQELSQTLTKPFKLCYDHEIHRLSKIPADYASLVQSFHISFKKILPTAFKLQYEDADGDLVMLKSDEDYQDMLECELRSSTKSIKVMLTPLEERAPTELSASRIDLNDISKTESVIYSIIPTTEKKDDTEIICKSQKNSENAEANQDLVLLKEDFSDTQKENQEKNSMKVSETVSVILGQLESEKQKENSEPIDTSVLQEARKSEPNQSTMEIVGAKDNIENQEAEPRNEYSEEKIEEIQPSQGKSKPKSEKLRKRTRSTKKERMREVVTDVMLENLPAIADLIKDYLKNPNTANLAMLTTKNQQNTLSNSAVHSNVICDGCGVTPLIGIRYKCSECDDFDYCEKCEATLEHSHTFLKIRDPKQYSALVEKDSFIGADTLENLGRSLISTVRRISEEAQETVSNAFNAITKTIFGQVEEIEEKVPEKIDTQEEAPMPKEKLPLDMSFVREICTIPSKITVNEKSVYKTIVIQNSGTAEWPKIVFLRNIEGVPGRDTPVIQLVPGKQFSCILILEGQSMAGDYNSSWRLGYNDDKGNVQFIGEPITVRFSVIEPKISQQQVMKESLKEEEAKNEVKSEKMEEKPKKVYTKRVEEFAGKVKEIFPDADMDELLEEIETSPKMTLEELLEKYIRDL